MDMNYTLNDYLTYPVKYEVDPKTGVTTAYFRDFDGMTQSDTFEEIREYALDWLTLCGNVCPANRQIIPAASKPLDGEDTITISPTLAMKFILRNIMTSKNLRPSDLGRLMGMSSQSVNALLNVYRNGTRFDTLYEAVAVCGATISVSGSGALIS